ncbi:MAG: GtrA family protein [Clostridia bacterium]|nr:GtrA family protein [Clostridia bacterium]
MKALIEQFKKHREVIMYIIFGVLTTVVDILVFSLLAHTIFDTENPLLAQIANIIAWIAAVAFAYVTNRIFVFESKEKRILIEILSFTASRLLTLVLDAILIYVLASLIGINPDVSNIISNVVVIVLNYVISKLFVFRRAKKNNP